MTSAIVGSPSDSCQALVGICDVTAVEPSVVAFLDDLEQVATLALGHELSKKSSSTGTSMCDSLGHDRPDGAEGDCGPEVDGWRFARSGACIDVEARCIVRSWSGWNRRGAALPHTQVWWVVATA